MELINKYNNPTQVEVVKVELEKLNDHDKALFAAESIESLIADVKTTGFGKWALKAGKVIAPLALGAILGHFYPDVATMISGFLG